MANTQVTKRRVSSERQALHQALERRMEAALFGRFNVEGHGHSHDIVLLKRLVPILALMPQSKPKSLRRLLDVIDGKGLAGSYEREAIAIGASDNLCVYCGQPNAWAFDGNAFRAATSCTFVGNKPVSVDFTIPNGTLAVGSDFRDVFRPEVAEIWGRPAERMYDPGSYAEMEECTRYLAAVGCAFGYLDTPGVSLYRARGGDLVVASMSDAIGAALGWEHLVTFGKPGSFSLTDRRLYRPRLGEPDTASYLEVPKGAYRMHIFGYMREFQPCDREVVICARIERVGDLPRRK